MFSCLSPAALGLPLDHTAAIDLALAHGWGVDPDPEHFRTLWPTAARKAVSARRRPAGEGPAVGWPVSRSRWTRRPRVPPPSNLFPTSVLTAAGVTAVGTWIRLHQTLDHAADSACTPDVCRWSPRSSPTGLRLGLEYIGPKTFWSTERHPFVHDITDARALIAETDASNIGLISTATTGLPPARPPRTSRASPPPTSSPSTSTTPARTGRATSEVDLDRRLPYDHRGDRPRRVHGCDRRRAHRPVKVEPFMKSLTEQPVDGSSPTLHPPGPGHRRLTHPGLAGAVASF